MPINYPLYIIFHLKVPSSTISFEMTELNGLHDDVIPLEECIIKQQ